MIINDTYKIAFVHIPKCAGTTVRNMLLEYDDLSGAHTSKVDVHPEIGPLDYVHIPLFCLRDYFPNEFKKIASYWSFSVVRNPYSRFTSSLVQRIDRHCKTPAKLMTAQELEREAQKVIGFLRENDGAESLLPPEYIHFQRQSDFVFLDGKKVIDAVYTTKNLTSLQTALEQKIGRSLHMPQSDPIKNNKSQVFKNGGLRVLFRLTAPVQKYLVKVLPVQIKNKIKKSIFKDRKSGKNDLSQSPYVAEFVSEYYAHDIQLFSAASSGESK